MIDSFLRGGDPQNSHISRSWLSTSLTRSCSPHFLCSAQNELFTGTGCNADGQEELLTPNRPLSEIDGVVTIPLDISIDDVTEAIAARKALSTAVGAGAGPGSGSQS